MPDLYALLIGINYYLPNLLPNGLYYNSLRGCVSDVSRMDAFLRTRLNVPEKNIIKLTSSNDDDKKPPEPRSQWPTYENIVNGFKKIAAMAQRGDRVFIHYSGHGGRTLTSKAFRHLKGPRGLDEVLVPMDLGNSEGRYLRDTELHFLLTRMVGRGLIVFIVLDSCHAAGATRNPVVRGIGVVDETVRPSDSLVASPEELVRAWESHAKANMRQAGVASGWLLEPEGYTLLAACRANEQANEHSFEKGETNGALSYWLVDSLKQIGPEFTYKVLHDRVLAKVHSQFVAQTPQLEGEGDRVVFSADTSLSQFAITVMNVNPDKTMTLNAGKAHGVWPGSRLNVFALNTTDLTDNTKRVALIEVSEARAVESTATMLKKISALGPESGCQAVLLDAGSVRLRRWVRFETSGEEFPAVQQQKALDTIADAVARRVDRFLALAAKDEAPDYRVTIDNEGRYRICDPAGVEIPNLKPALYANDKHAPVRMAERLVHLARYANVRELDNNDARAVVPRKLVVELMGWQKTYEDGEKLRPERFKGRPIIKHGEWGFVRVRNNYSEALNITVLDLQPDWGITQIYPEKGGAFELLDPGQDLTLPIRFTLPPDYESGTDVIKFFATVEPTSFRWLELPSLDQSESPENLRGESTNIFEEFLHSLSQIDSPVRQAKVPSGAGSLWVVRQIEIEVQR